MVISGTLSFPGVVNVTLSATNQFGSDAKVLAITINEPVEAPRINSSLSAIAFRNQPFTYQFSASGTQPMVFNATNLPAGLTFDAEFGVISGVPTVSGAFNVTLTATNSAGTDTKTLEITVPQSTPVQTDADNDGVPDALDAYPTDGERAFNSFYPNEVDFATYAFEDLWPAYGDYDFNDLVVNFNYY